MTRRRQAFTLVELLVVIGIIAVLISVLLPTLGRARESAQKTQCLAALRELGNSMRIYASQNRDCVPLGFVAGAVSPQKQFSYTVVHISSNSGNIRRPLQMGVLVSHNIVRSGKAFYCPSNTDPQLQYDNRDAAFFNPWPFNEKGVLDQLGGVPGNTRVSYMTRPVARFQPLGPVDTIERKPSTGTDDFVPGWPKLSKMKNKAIVSDMARFAADVLRHHRGKAQGLNKYTNMSPTDDKSAGINVLYANGGAMWVPAKVLLQDRFYSATFASNDPNHWGHTPDDPDSTSINDVILNENRAAAFGPLAKPPPVGVWRAMDSQMP